MGGVVDAITGSGASKAAKAQANASNAAIATQKQSSDAAVQVQREGLAQQREMFNKALELGQPYRTAGQEALDQYTGLLNGTGEQQQAALENTPGYQFQMDQGTQAVERGAAARSGVLSGAQSKALTRFGQGLASTQFNTFMDRLANLSTMGANSAAGAGSAAISTGQANAGVLQNIGNTISTTGQNIGSLQSQVGAAQASGYLSQQKQGTDMLNTAMMAFAMSSREVKEDIIKIGEQNGFNIYQFKYKGYPGLYEGVIAEEVEEIMPEAVVMIDGIKAVDYNKIGIQMRVL